MPYLVIRNIKTEVGQVFFFFKMMSHLKLNFYHLYPLTFPFSLSPLPSSVSSHQERARKAMMFKPEKMD